MGNYILIFIFTFMKITILNGPNLNHIGQREPEIYGIENFDSLLQRLEKDFPILKIKLKQTNCEGELIDYLQEANQEAEAVILNAGAYTHTSIAIADAVRCMQIPVVEVHISNVYARESYRQHSYLSPHVLGTIGGFGMQSYSLAVQALIQYQK